MWKILGWILGVRGVYRVLLGKPEGKRPLWRRRRRWVDNFRMDLWGEVLYSFLVWKPEGKRPLGRPRRRWVNNIWMDQRVRFCIGSWWVNRGERDQWGDLGVGKCIILE